MKNNKTPLLSYLLPAVLIAALAVCFAWGMTQKAKAEEYFSAAGEYMGSTYSAYERCANELASNVHDMEVSLAKLSVAGSQSAAVLALEDIVRSSAASVSIMSRLPRRHAATEQLTVFLVRTGDCARALSRRVLAGEELSESDITSLENAHAACAALTESLHEAISNSELPLDNLDPGGFYAESDEIFAPGGMQSAEDSDGSEYPEFDYDGPYSESAENAEASGLSGEAVTEEAALAEAERLTGVSLRPIGRAEGSIPVWLFEGEDGERRTCTAAVTATGGRLLWFMSDCGGEAVGEPEAAEYASLIAAGASWLAAAGLDGMTPTYARFYGGAALISYVFEQEGVKVYNDLVKLWIERGSLRIVGADANEYYFNHRERDIPRPTLTEAEARSLACGRLKIDSASLALIPPTPSAESLCWELHGFYNDDEYVVFINALTGTEERISIVINDGNGRYLL